MNKKLFGALLAFVLVFSQTVVSFAALSGTTSVTTIGNTTIAETNNFVSVTDAEALSILELAVNTDATDAEIVNAVNATGDVKITTANFVTEFYDVTVSEKSSDGFYHATLEVPALPANASTANVRGLHYSIERGIWEVVTPVSVNGKIVEFGLADCSPLAVYVTDAATSPATGAAGNWTLFMGAAVVLFAVSAMAHKKSR